jgi:hypothetical protein
MKSNIEEIVKTLEPEIDTCGRQGMVFSSKMIYSNKDTGTVVFECDTSNVKLVMYNFYVDVTHWVEYVVGNENGFLRSGQEVMGYACSREIFEDEEKVVIPRYGTVLTHFDIEVPAEDIIFDKDKFVPYGTKDRSRFGRRY